MKKASRRPIALLISAHNEELLLGSTLRSAYSAGIPKCHIYVVDDNSSDATARIAKENVGRGNVMTVKRSGKAKALYLATKHFKIEKKYVWLHVADADSIFSKNYFRIMKRDLRSDKYCAAVGFVQSLKGNWISCYRTCLYSFGQEVNRRIQAIFHVIPVMPGPTSVYRTDILKHLNFFANSVTEDFDITLQIYRKNLGHIQFIPKAINYTQDPKNFYDYSKQILRWNKGFFQSIFNHKIGLHPRMIDVYLIYQIISAFLILIQIAIVIPVILLLTKKPQYLQTLVYAEAISIVSMAFFGAVTTQRPYILRYTLFFYILKIADFAIFIYALFYVVITRILGLGKNGHVGWSTAGRRTKITKEMLASTT